MIFLVSKKSVDRIFKILRPRGILAEDVGALMLGVYFLTDR